MEEAARREAGGTSSCLLYPLHSEEAARREAGGASSYLLYPLHSEEAARREEGGTSSCLLNPLHSEEAARREEGGTSSYHAMHFFLRTPSGILEESLRRKKENPPILALHDHTRNFYPKENNLVQ